MFELAISYFNLKKEMDKIKISDNDENKGLSWVEMERRKNFPCEYYN